jgi:hypothetical protein
MIFPASRCTIAVQAALAAALVSSFPAWSGPVVPVRPPSSVAHPPAAQRATHIANLQARVFGRTYGEWAAQWVAWSEAGPFGANAITDMTGDFCAANQPPALVWFLAGTFGGAVERSCNIPAGRALFYPIVESPWIDCPNTPDVTLSDEEVRDIIGSSISGPIEIASTLNGIPIANLQVMVVRTQTAKFTSVLPDNNVLDGLGFCPTALGGGRTGRRIADGYWVMLPPLPPGQHTLTFRGAVGSPPGFETSVTYNLTVAPHH